jgi:hypothetical protein
MQRLREAKRRLLRLRQLHTRWAQRARLRTNTLLERYTATRVIRPWCLA